MADLTKSQIAALETQRNRIEEIFRSTSGIVSKHSDLDRLTKKKLVQVITFLNKASNLIASLTEDDDEEGDEGDSD